MARTDATAGDADLPRWHSVAYWRDFLAAHSVDVMREREYPYEWRRYSEEQLDSGWLGREGATEEELVSAEERLGIRLPPSYRAFLTASNGFSHLGPFNWEMRTTHNVDWFRSAEPGIWAILREGDAELTAFMDRVLLVSDESDAQHWLLDPGTVSLDREWTAVIWAGWHPGFSDVCPSFGDLVAQERASYEGLWDDE
ncbi:SMI1/KNR4 family protein [Streptomyces sp. NPDC088387]|uniref:SMI1/KNR4 family protein n=1 Tax=Streptomyces sp. NPDC088387 TaxID=3365859 RepID=UPI003815897F